MRTILTLLLSLCVATAALSAKTFEGKLRIKVTEGKGRSQEMDYLAKPGFMRADMNAEGQNASVIVDFAKKEAIMLMPGQPMYMVMPLPQAMEQTVGKPEDTQLEKTSITEKILGYDCVKYLLKAKNGVSEMWITEALGAFMSMPAMGGPMGGAPKPSPTSGWENALKGKDFFPLRVVSLGKNGKESSRFEILSIEPKTLEASLFAPPAGYQRFDMGAMGGFPGMPGMKR